MTEQNKNVLEPWPVIPETGQLVFLLTVWYKNLGRNT